MWSIGLLERPPRTEIDNMLHRLEEAFDLYALHLGDRGGAGGLAEEVGDAPIAVLATSDLAALGQRFVNQLAEHSGRFARLEIVPEQNHNMLVAWGAIGTDGDASAFEHAVLILEWEGAPTHTSETSLVHSTPPANGCGDSPAKGTPCSRPSSMDAS